MLKQGNDYQDKILAFRDNHTILKKIDPNNEHVELIDFDNHGGILVKPEFWEKYGSNNKEIFHYNLRALEEANNQLEETIREFEETVEVKGKRIGF